jgi:hypothetical protein
MNAGIANVRGGMAVVSGQTGCRKNVVCRAIQSAMEPALGTREAAELRRPIAERCSY